MFCTKINRQSANDLVDDDDDDVNDDYNYGDVTLLILSEYGRI